MMALPSRVHARESIYRVRVDRQPAGRLRRAARQIDCDQSHIAIPHPCHAHVGRVAGDVREVPAVRRKGWLRIDTIRVRDNQRPHGATVHGNQVNASRSLCHRGAAAGTVAEVQLSRVPGHQPLTIG